MHRFSSCHGSSGSWILCYHDPDDQPDDQSDSGDDLEDQQDGPDDQSDGGDDLEYQPHGPDDQSDGRDDLEDQPDGEDDLENRWDSVEEGGGRCLFLRNPFHASVAPIQIPWPCREPPKIVLCSSSVAILHRGICTIAPFWAADMTGPLPEHRTWLPLTGDYVDIGFYHGKIFTLTQLGELFSHDLFGRRSEHVTNQSLGPYDQVLDNTVCHVDRKNTVCHQVVSADKEKLLMVRWGIPRRKTMAQNSILRRNTMVRQSIPRRKAIGVAVHERRPVMNLHVFEADLANGQWSEVKDLESQALFINRSCCRAFRSPDHLRLRLAHLRLMFPQGNCVYILGVDWHLKRTVHDGGPCKCRNCHVHVNGGVPSYCVYDMVTDTTSLVSLGGGHHMENARSEWFFPCE